MRYTFLLLPFFLVGLLFSQTAPSSNAQASATFQSNVRVVLLDVIVTDSNGAPVTGLSENDFRVFEDNKQQKIASFKEHNGAPIARAVLPPMPPNVYTNYPVVESADSINVIMMDSLNTQMPDQQFVHQQTLKYLKTLPVGARVAIFTLSSRLRMVQEFTSDSSRLLAALNDPALSLPRHSPLLKSQAESQAETDLINQTKVNQMSQSAIPATLAQEAVDPVNSLNALIAEKDAAMTEARIGITLSAFQQLARYLSAYPGRKNVIWVSGSFPIVLFPDANLLNPAVTPKTYMLEIQKTADLCAAAQIAIYPVTAEGLMIHSVYQADGSAISEQRPSMMGQNNVDQMNAELQSVSSTRLTAESLAKNTGGQAFFNSNGITDILTRVTNQGMHYYALSYSPTNTKTDNRFRHTRVESTNPKYSLSYRRGYYATDSKTGLGAADAQDPLLPLMGFGLPDTAQIVYKLSVTSSSAKSSGSSVNAGSNPKGPTTHYTLDYGVSLNQIKLDVQPDGSRYAQLEVKAVAYDDAGKPLNMTGQRGLLNITPEGFQEARESGVHFQEELDLPSNTDVHLRTGVYDLNSGNAGTLGVRVHTQAAGPN
jgi:VWFA-related protein